MQFDKEVKYNFNHAEMKYIQWLEDRILNSVVDKQGEKTCKVYIPETTYKCNRPYTCNVCDLYR
jgi:hypothetical protein